MTGPEALPGTLAAPVRAELEVKRSRFVADLAPIARLGDLDDLVVAARREFRDARHHCSAAVAGDDADQGRSHDDGEPGGTAGAPMLAVLRGSGLTDLGAVVTRYFGGTLLGAGGLVRAYGDAVSAALAEARVLERRAVSRCTAHVALADVGRFEHRLRHVVGDLGGTVADGAYDADGATFEVVVPATRRDRLWADLAGCGIVHRLTHVSDEVRAVRR